MTGALLHRRRLAAAAALLAAAAVLPGCLVVPCVTRTTTGELLPSQRVKAIQDGATTAADVLEWLGPPLVVVRRPEGVVQVPEVGFRRSGVSDVPAASFFERFAPGAVAPGDLVYFYREHEISTHGTGALVIVLDRGGVTGSSRDEHRDDRLWLLLDGGTGLVKAHVHERDEPPPSEPQGNATGPTGEGEPWAGRRAP